MNSLESQQLFFDPFAEEQEKYFDPLTAFETMYRKYQDGDVEHDYTADKFVMDIEALRMDVQFLGRFQDFEAIAGMMHQLCAGDEHLQQAVNSRAAAQSQGHSHNHSHTSSNSDEDHENLEDDDTDDQTPLSLYQLIVQYFKRKNNTDKRL